MKVQEKSDRLIISEQSDFEPKHIFECGQAFRWEKELDNSYTIVANKRVINVSKLNDEIIIKNSNKEDFNEIWKDYFDIDTDYSQIKSKLNNDDIMKKAIEFGTGIRILNQQEYEMIISFIISANNRIPMIKKVISNLSKKFGDFIQEYNSKKYYSFPSIERLANADVEKVAECKAGFRSERIILASQKIIQDKDIVYNLKSKTYDEGLEYLKTYKGIGDKVANCILLFSMKQFATFPVDVWVRRVMQTLYVPNTAKDLEIRKFAENKFKDLSGYAQQYLFFYARENDIGK
ncbi:DNA-3-methyladenine glycosylase 2 family protein [Sedimentibacter sp. zth1]|uniref:DNA-3-methyladenine glycosylase family protein n=1 Tax=Sedimentibacter sp. zth1 TaxID=2816908 RepID=UPI001A91B2BD|nr:DNA-3-methyladenine glycosylase 2 family protein [Sedimentibacter sp. zth1]QSX04813.1 DNA-3-methyladenine glycosylase 2 family protein [Sedimentibacter sp. zth1]